MIIRIMSAEDYERVYLLWLHTPNMGMNALDDSKDGISRYLRHNPTTCFVAEQDGEIVGAILCGHDGRRGFIYHMAVAENVQRQGIGDKLLKNAISALEKEGIHKVALVAFWSNQKGNAFWEKQGFIARDDLVYRNRVIGEVKKD